MSSARVRISSPSTFAWRAIVATSAMAVIASFAAAPVANAAGQPAGAAHPAPRTAARYVSRQVVPARHAHHLHVDVAKPGKIAMRKVPLWHGTPSYVLRPNHRTTPDVVPGISGPCQIGAGNHSGTWSPAACPNGYEVQADITVPVGKTLTIEPKTVVYFDTTLEGALGALDPSELPDLVVDGTLKVAGTAAQPVLFTSANAAPKSTLLPAAGDWGYVFFNHTGSDKGTGSLTHLRLLFGEGIAADRSAPAITDSRVSDVAAGLTTPTIATSITKGAGIDYEDVPPVTASFNGDTFDFGNSAGIAVESVDAHTGFSGATYPGNPFTFSLVDSAVTGGLPSGFSDEIGVFGGIKASTSAANHDVVTVNVHGNTLTNTGVGAALDVSADSDSTTVPGTAEVTGAIHDNSILGGIGSHGVSVNTDVEDSTHSGIKACAGASSCVSVPFLHDNVSSYNTAVQLFAEVATGAGSSLVSAPVGRVDKKKVKKHVTCKHQVKGKKQRTCTKSVTKLVDVSGGTYRSDNNEAWEPGTLTEGSGAATVRTPVVATTFSSDGANIDSEARADQGTATNSVSARHSTMTSLGATNVQIETEGSLNAAPPTGSTGGSHSTVSVVGGHYAADEENIDVEEADAHYGPASSAVTVTGAKLTADGANAEEEVDASESGGSGGATSTTTVSGSTLVAADAGIESAAEASYGAAPATSKVSVTHSTVDSGDQSVESDATSSQHAGSHGNAVVDTSLSHDTVQTEEEALELEAESDNGGSATSNPKLVDSTVLASDEAVENEARSTEDSGQGAAVAQPTITSSTITSGDEILENEARAEHGNSAANGSFTITGSTLFATGDDGVDSDADGAGTGASTINPAVKNVNLRTVDDDGFSLETDSGGSGPMRIGGSITGTTVHSEDNAFDVDLDGSVGSSATFTTVFKDDTAVVTDDEGFSASGDASGASATLSPTITGGSISAPDDAAIDLRTSGYGGSSSDVLEVAPTISHESTYSEDGVELESRDTNGAAAPGATVVGGSLTDDTIVSTDSSGIDAEANCTYCLGGARTHVKVLDTPISSGEDAGEFFAMTASTTTASASVGGSVTSTHHDAWTAGDGPAVLVLAQSAKGSATSAMNVSGLRMSGSDGAMTTVVTATTGAATYSGSVTGNSAGSQQSAGSGGIFADISGGTTVHDTGSVSHNTITDGPASDAGISEQADAGTVVTEAKHIEDNRITDVATGNGIYVGISSPDVPAASTLLTVAHNSITRTGLAGIEIHGARAAVTANKVTFAGENSATGYELDGVYADDEPYQGTVTCNAIWGNPVGIGYGATNPTTGAGGHNGDPKTNDNTFKSPTSSTRNALDLTTANAGTGQTDAQSNYWGGTPRLGTPASHYDTSPVLSKAPKCTSTAGA